MRRLLVLAITLISVGWLAVPGAAAAQSVHINPQTVPAGGTVRVSGGSCEPHTTTGFVFSAAFFNDYASHDFAGLGAAQFTTDANGDFSVTAQVAAGTAPGNYSVGVRCGGGNFGQVNLKVTAAVRPAAASSAPTAVPAGSGGLAATGRTAPPQLLLGGVGLLLLVLGGALLLIRRRPRSIG